MAPRNPDESLVKDGRNAVPQVLPDAPDPAASGAADAARQAPPAPGAQPEEPLRTRVDPDRVEVYLKGPTVFSA